MENKSRVTSISHELFHRYLGWISNWLPMCVIAAVTLQPHCSSAGVVAWGTNDSGQINVPSGLAAVLGIAAGDAHSLAVKGDGTVVAWGSDSDGQTNVPAGFSNVVSIAAGGSDCMALPSNSIPVMWGGNSYATSAAATNLVAIGVGSLNSIGVRRDGTLTGWGSGGPVELATNMVGVTVAAYQAYSLCKNGTVAVWVTGVSGVVGYWGSAGTQPGMSNIVAVSMSAGHVLALTKDGTVVAAGSNTSGQCNTPSGLSNVVAVAAGGTYSLALLRNGTVVGWGDNSSGQLNIPPGLTNVVAIAASPGGAHSLALVGEGAPKITRQPLDASTYSGNPIQLQGAAVGAAPLFYQWQHDGTNIIGATNFFYFLQSPQLSDAGSYALIVSNSLNTATSLKANLTISNIAPTLVSTFTDQQAYPGKNVLLTESVIGSTPFSYTWQYNGAVISGATGSALSFTAENTSSGQYSVVVTNAYGSITNTAAVTVMSVLGWPQRASEYPIYPPIGVTDVVVLATAMSYTSDGSRFDIGVRRNGTLAAWDANGNATPVPQYVTNAVSIVADVSVPPTIMVVNADGTLANWTYPVNYQVPIHVQSNAPPPLNRVVSLCAGNNFGFALLADGTVAPAWGPTPPIPAGLSNVVAIAAGSGHGLALKSDGTVVGWGDNSYGQTNVPLGLSNVVAVAAANRQSIALGADGVAVVWGSYPYGSGNGSAVPSGWTNLIAIGASTAGARGIRTNGVIATAGPVAAAPAGLTNVVALYQFMAGDDVIAVAGPIAPFLTLRPLDTTLGAGSDFTFMARSVGSLPQSYQWSYNGGPLTNANQRLLTLTNIQAGQAGTYSIVVTNAFGATTSSFALFVTNTAPVISLQPQNVTAPLRTNVVFSVSARGSLPMQFQWQFNGANLSGATDSTLTLTNIQTTNNGSYRVAITNVGGYCLSSNATLAVVIPVFDALDATNLAWSVSGNVPWFGQPTVTHDGNAAAQSGRIGDFQQSILQTMVTGPGQLTFWWKVSSEQYYDVLTFFIGSTQYAQISGEMDWNQESIAVPAGIQTLQWVYSKDGSTSVGQDAGWLDQVSYSGNPAPPVLTQVSNTAASFQASALTINGKSYVFEYKHAITDPVWVPISTNLGNGGVQVFIDSSTASTQRFYRIRQSN